METLDIDFTKAFDSLDHSKLLGKLPALGLCQDTVLWFGSYLAGRKQKTVCNKTESLYENVTYWIPQGSILGPLLFIIYVNSLPNLPVKANHKLYADDTLLIRQHVQLDTLNHELQQDLDKISLWCNQNGLTINVNKSKSMLIGSGEEEMTLSMNGVELESVPQYKYLGIQIDKAMTFAQQTAAMFQNIRYKLWLLMQTREYVDQYTSLLIMKSMLVPYFDYGLVFTTGTQAPVMNKFHVLYNKCIRVCYKIRDARDARVKDLYVRAKMLPIDLRRVYLQLTMCHRLIFSGQVRTLPSTGTRATHAPIIYRTQPKLVGLVKDPVYQAFSQWNALDQVTRWLDKDQFKKEIKRRLLLFFIREWRADQLNLIFNDRSVLVWEGLVVNPQPR